VDLNVIIFNTIASTILKWLRLKFVSWMHRFDLGSSGKQPDHYLIKAKGSSCSGFMPRRVLELKCKGNKLLG
jgi:hypothetical protein